MVLFQMFQCKRIYFTVRIGNGGWIIPFWFHLFPFNSPCGYVSCVCLGSLSVWIHICTAHTGTVWHQNVFAYALPNVTFVNQKTYYTNDTRTIEDCTPFDVPFVMFALKNPCDKSNIRMENHLYAIACANWVFLYAGIVSNTVDIEMAFHQSECAYEKSNYFCLHQMPCYKRSIRRHDDYNLVRVHFSFLGQWIGNGNSNSAMDVVQHESSDVRLDCSSAWIA